MISHPIQNNPHPAAMAFADQLPKVLVSTKLGIDEPVVLDSIRGAKGAFAVHDTYRMHRHEPQGVAAKPLNSIQSGNDSLQVSLGAEVADVNLVNTDRVHRNGRMAVLR